MQRTARITFSVTPEVYEELRRIAYARRLSISGLVRQTTEEMIGLLAGTVPSQGRAGRRSVTSVKGQPPTSTDTTALIPRGPDPKAPVAKRSTWSVICPQRNAHVFGEVCPHCGGSGPR